MAYHCNLSGYDLSLKKSSRWDRVKNMVEAKEMVESEEMA